MCIRDRAKAIVDGAPKTLKEAVSKDEAEAMKAKPVSYTHLNAARAEAGSAVPAAVKAYFIILIGFKSAVSRGHLKRQRDICAERHGGS